MSCDCHRNNRKRALSTRLPFGVGTHKPKHFRDMLKIAWENKDNLSYAWKILSRGVCDGCALGVAGLHDWTIQGVHLCMTRLNLLRLNTMPAMPADALEDVRELQGKSNRELRSLGRLAYPMRRLKGEAGFHRVSWDEAFQSLAEHFQNTPPQRSAFFVTARGVTNEVYYMAQKAARFMGTNHVDNAARLCHAPSTAAMKRTLGIAATTCSYKDWIGTDLIVFFGSNPANDQPVSTKYLHEAKAAGTKVAMVNPYCEPGMERYWVPSNAGSALFGTAITDHWFPVSQGGDIAFLCGVMKILVAEDWIDRSFLESHTEGFESLERQLSELEWGPLERDAGLDKSSMLAMAELIRDAKNAVLVWSMGITQHGFGTEAVQAILNLGLLRGYLGKGFNGLMPIRGHSSVQGGAEMGAYSTVFPGGVPVNASNAKQLSEQYGFQVPDWPGYSAVEMIEAASKGDLDILYSVGGNFLRTLPEPKRVADALCKVKVRVHQDILLTDQAMLEGGEEVWLLPAKTRYEQRDGGVETSTERRVMFSPEIPRQVGEAMSEWEILRELAVRAFPEKADQMGCESGWLMREEIARIVPFYDGIQDLRQTGDAFQYGGPHLCPEGVCPTPSSKAIIHPLNLPEVAREPGSYWVSTRRGKQFNTLIYSEVDPLNGAPRKAVLISHEDCHREGLTKGDRVILKNAMGRFEGVAWPVEMAPGNLQIHWPEGNDLIASGRTDRGGGVPDYNARVTLEVR